MERVRGFFAFWYDFVVGDDWVLAVGVVVALALTAAVARSGAELAAWALMPVLAVAVLALSLWRAARAQE